MIVDIQEVENKIITALDAAVALGYTIVCDTWGFLENKTCCAIGAMALQANPKDQTDFICICTQFMYQFLNTDDEPKTSAHFWAFLNGFNQMDGDLSTFNDPWFDLGVAMRQKYNPICTKNNP